MGILKRLFPKKKSVISFEEQVNNEIYNCEQAIFSYQKDIHKIRRLAADLIHKTLVVPQKFWYEELNYLENIFELPENKKIDKLILEDIKNICESYKQQLELRLMKIKVCRKNRDELKEMISQEDSLRRKIDNELKPENIIEQHKELSQSIFDSDISKEISVSQKVEFIKDDVNSLRKELSEKKEFNKQLQILYSKYGNSEDITSVKIYLEELKKLIEK